MLESFDRIHELMGCQRLATMRSFYEIGKELVQLRKFPPLSVLGRPLLDAMADELDVSPRLLRDFEILAESVPEETFNRLPIPPLCWTHIRILISQGQISNVEDWVDRIVRENMKTADLERELRCGRPSQRPGSGRRPKPPSSLRSGLRQLVQSATTFTNKSDVLFGDQFHVAGAVKNSAPEDLTPDVREDFVQALHALEAIQAKLTDEIDVMRKTLPWFASMEAVQRRQLAAEASDESRPKLLGGPRGISLDR